jgi:preprotein translocase subunit SecF
MQIIKYSRVWLTLSFLAVAVSVLLVGVFGLKLSADFVEGSLYELQFSDGVGKQEILNVAADFEGVLGSSGSSTGTVDVRTTKSETFVMRLKRLEPEESEAFLTHLEDGLGAFSVIQDRQVSPVFAETFKQRAVTALVFASLMIVLYVAFAFRRVSKGVKSWKLGVCAVIALVHDVLITTGLFVVFGLLYGVEVDALFITALLAVMGFSVNDTIVVFDRLRENLMKHFSAKRFEDIVNESLLQTIMRSINTSVSTLLVLVALLVFGSPEIFWFVMALTVGVVIGTYSSIFLASPLLVLWQRR